MVTFLSYHKIKKKKITLTLLQQIRFVVLRAETVNLNNEYCYYSPFPSLPPPPIPGPPIHTACLLNTVCLCITVSL